MRLLDLFCGAGGAAMGYYRAGFDVVGVDLSPQKHYPFEFHQADAMQVLQTLVDGGTWAGYSLPDFDAIHASPPCEEYSNTRPMRLFNSEKVKEQPMLIAPVLDLLRASGVPWVVENVSGARADLPNAIALCGISFGLPMLRHRLFLSSELLFAPAHLKHPDGYYNVAGGAVRAYGAYRTAKLYTCKDGRVQRREGHCRKEVGQRAMGIDWMTVKEMSKAIPPVYTEWIGQQLLNILEREAA